MADFALSLGPWLPDVLFPLLGTLLIALSLVALESPLALPSFALGAYGVLRTLLTDRDELSAPWNELSPLNPLLWCCIPSMLLLGGVEEAWEQWETDEAQGPTWRAVAVIGSLGVFSVLALRTLGFSPDPRLWQTWGVLGIWLALSILLHRLGRTPEEA